MAANQDVSHCNFLHGEAMRLASDAEWASRNEPQATNTIRCLYRKSQSLEEQAAKMAGDAEPSRSVLFRSAASLAMSAGDEHAAIECLLHGLAGNPPAEIRAEMIQLYREIFQS